MSRVLSCSVLFCCLDRDRCGFGRGGSRGLELEGCDVSWSEDDRGILGNYAFAGRWPAGLLEVQWHIQYHSFGCLRFTGPLRSMAHAPHHLSWRGARDVALLRTLPFPWVALLRSLPISRAFLAGAESVKALVCERVCERVCMRACVCAVMLVCCVHTLVRVSMGACVCVCVRACLVAIAPACLRGHVLQRTKQHPSSTLLVSILV